ncbi:MAG: septal ring lytic transglycosylase RlpA family protein [Alphaproteobacteria bacterium]|nr:septal ring lytic transglycosylase RlpA family protein [Alphaproteobacteria bacterium]
MTVSVLPRWLSAQPVHKPLMALMLAMALALAGCATPRYGAPPTPHHKVGKPYKVKNKWYRPAHDPDYNKVGTASWYGRDFHGRATANGEIYNMNAMTAAHTTLPLPSMVEVTNLENRRKVVVRVNDRGPFASNRIIDLSRAAARRLGFEKNGLAKVRVRYLGPAALPGQRSNRIYAKAAPKQPAAVAAQDHHHHPITEVRNGVTGAVSVVEAPSLANAPTQTTAVAPSEPASSQAIEAILASAPTLPSVQPQAAPPEGELAEAHPHPEATPSPAAVEAPPVAATTLYVIRVAALSSLDNIEAVRASLGAVGTLRLTRVDGAGGKVFYRVNMGPYSTRAEALKRLEAVREAGYGDARMITITP